MDYEKAYKEAVERAKDLHDNHPYGEPPVWTTCEKIFPELKESEDERIKKEILELVSNSGNGNQFEEIKKWLEKQGEQKPAWSEEDERMKSLIISTLTSMGTLNLERYHHMNLDEVKNWLKSLKPHWKPSEEQMMTLCALCVLHKESKVLESLYNDLKNL